MPPTTWIRGLPDPTQIDLTRTASSSLYEWAPLSAACAGYAAPASTGPSGHELLYSSACGYVADIHAPVRSHRDTMRPDELTIVIPEGAGGAVLPGRAQLENARAIRAMLGHDHRRPVRR